MAVATKTLVVIASMLMCAAAGIPVSGHAETSRASEAAVKATYLYKFVPFVTWPSSDPGNPITICIVGRDPFGSELDRAIAGQSYGQRGFQVIRLSRLDSQSQCDIAHIDGPSKIIATNLAEVRGRPVLTVTNDGHPAGVIDFTIKQGRVRFRVDQTAARDNGLQISSKLLELAFEVRQ